MTNANGSIFEELLIKSNEIYKYKGMALINKVPTPWAVSYDRKLHRVKKAFPKEKSTVDFEGVAHGKSVAFEAKSTRERKRFDLKNVKQHQIDYLQRHQEQGGISFFLVEFVKHGEVYFITFDQMHKWWEAAREGGRKSIPYDWIQMNCEIVTSGRGIYLDYLKFVNGGKC